MKTIVATISSFSLSGAKVVKDDIEFVSGEGTATLVSQGNLNHTITVILSESQVDTVTAIFRQWGWEISDPQLKDQN